MRIKVYLPRGVAKGWHQHSQSDGHTLPSPIDNLRLRRLKEITTSTAEFFANLLYRFRPPFWGIEMKPNYPKVMEREGSYTDKIHAILSASDYANILNRDHRTAELYEGKDKLVGRKIPQKEIDDQLERSDKALKEYQKAVAKS